MVSAPGFHVFEWRTKLPLWGNCELSQSCWSWWEDWRLLKNSAKETRAKDIAASNTQVVQNQCLVVFRTPADGFCKRVFMSFPTCWLILLASFWARWNWTPWSTGRRFHNIFPPLEMLRWFSLAGVRNFPRICCITLDCLDCYTQSWKFFSTLDFITISIFLHCESSNVLNKFNHKKPLYSET